MGPRVHGRSRLGEALRLVQNRVRGLVVQNMGPELVLLSFSSSLGLLGLKYEAPLFCT